MSESTSTTAVYKGIRTAEGLKLLASEPITVIVGTATNKKTWHLPKELLINASPFFAAALNGSFAEATSRVVNLPEDNTDAFACFIQWLYVGEITANDCTADHEDGQYRSCSEVIAQTSIQAWILGNKLGCPIFKDLAMLCLIRALNFAVTNVDTVRNAYERSAPGSKLRKYILDQVRYDARGDVLGGGADEWRFLTRDCVDFGHDLMGAIFEKGDNIVEDPMEQKAIYLEVLTDDACV